MKPAANWYDIFSLPESCVTLNLAESENETEFQIFGNRVGLLSLSNVFLWLTHNPNQCEYSSVMELPFVQVDRSLSLIMRIADAEATNLAGKFVSHDAENLLEWSISEGDLVRVSLEMHKIVSDPHHEYSILRMEKGICDWLHMRMTDVENWI